MNYINQFIDERNSDLWNLLSASFNIQIQPANNGVYACFTKEKDAILYFNQSDICIDSFSHELLHIYLKHKEFYLGSSIKRKIPQSKILNRLFSENLLEHIGNCLDHLKMFEFYTELGFNNEKFLLDYDEHKCSRNELIDIKRNYKIGKRINTNTVDFYIGKLVAILCDPNSNHNYVEALSTLKKLDPKLYFAVETLIEQSKSYNIDNDDFLVSYRDISDDFYVNLISWIRLNNIK